MWKYQINSDFFTARQKRTVSFALTLAAALAIVVMLFYVFSVLLSFVADYSDAFVPPAVGLILSMFFRPLYLRLNKFFRGCRALSLVAIFLMVLVPLAAFLWFFGSIIADQVLQLVNKTPEMYESMRNWIISHMPELEIFWAKYRLDETFGAFSIQNWISKVVSTTGYAAVGVGSWLFDIVGHCLGYVLIPIYTALFLAFRPISGEDMKRLIVFASEKTQNNVKFLFDQFLDNIVIFFRGQVLVALIQGAFFAVGFQIAGLPYGFLLGLSLGLLNIVPYLGNVVGFAVIVPLALFCSSGGWSTLAWVLVVFALVQAFDSYFITPKIIGGRTGLSSLVVIFSLFFWNAVIGGILGMILAIPLSSFIVVAWRLLKRDYFTISQDSETHEQI